MFYSPLFKHWDFETRQASWDKKTKETHAPAFLLKKILPHFEKAEKALHAAAAFWLEGGRGKEDFLCWVLLEPLCMPWP